MEKKSLCGLTADEIYDAIRSAGFTSAHAGSVTRSLYKKRISEISKFEKISHRLKNELQEIAVSGLFLPVGSEISSDKTIRYLFRTKTGKVFETVFIPEKRRNTICVSVQSGCRMGCSFCVTARFGYKGDLTAGEILNQVLSIPQSTSITHVVFMGMGEPMDNLENVLKACNIMTAEWGLAISPRNITVSTVGISWAVEQFIKESDCNLALSLFSPYAEERIKYVPAERRYPSRGIIEKMKTYPVRKKRRLTIAYVMIKDLNDTKSHLDAITSILRGTSIRVNLLPYHKVGEDPECSSSAEKMEYFKHNLVISGVSASIRTSRGEDISAACGLLAGRLP